MAAAHAPLSDDQIDRLLQGAEERLLAKEQNGPSPPSAPGSRHPVTSRTASQTPATTSRHPTALAHKRPPAQLSVRVPQVRKPRKQQATKVDAGPAWFNLPKTNLTPELRRDLQILKMRNVLDPKRFYKKDTSKNAVPEFSQVGTVVAGPTEFYSARLTRKERKKTLLEEVLETEATTRRFKSKYGEIQAAKTSGKKAYYRKMMERRYGKKKEMRH